MSPVLSSRETKGGLAVRLYLYFPFGFWGGLMVSMTVVLGRLTA